MTEIPIEPKQFWGLFYLLCFGLAAFCVYGLLSTRQRSGDDPLDWLKSKFGAAYINDALFLCATLLWLAITLSLVVGLLAMIWEIIWSVNPNTLTGSTDLRFAPLRLTALAATLGGLIALPFTLLRLKLNREQTQTATESLFNDKIKTATDDLHTRRQISKVTQDPNGNEVLQTLWQDDITRRNISIDRLEGLVKERPDLGPRISQLLCVYVREVSRDCLPVETPEDATTDQLRAWADTLTVQRSDLQNAVHALGRLRGIFPDNPDAIPIDLKGANLQGFDLSRLDLMKAVLRGANMQGANLSMSQMQGADLSFSEMQGAKLRRANMHKADLSSTNMQATNLDRANMQSADSSCANMQGASLVKAKMQGANLSFANMKGAGLTSVQMQNADLSGANIEDTFPTDVNMQGVLFSDVEISLFEDFSSVNFQSTAMQLMNFTIGPLAGRCTDDIFGDGSNDLPTSTDWPAHWPKHELNQEEFIREWKKWMRDPENYVPPMQEDDPTAETAE